MDADAHMKLSVAPPAGWKAAGRKEEQKYKSVEFVIGFWFHFTLIFHILCTLVVNNLNNNQSDFSSGFQSKWQTTWFSNVIRAAAAAVRSSAPAGLHVMDWLILFTEWTQHTVGWHLHKQVNKNVTLFWIDLLLSLFVIQFSCNCAFIIKNVYYFLFTLHFNWLKTEHVLSVCKACPFI